MQSAKYILVAIKMRAEALLRKWTNIVQKIRSATFLKIIGLRNCILIFKNSEFRSVKENCDNFCVNMSIVDRLSRQF